ncbi:hypothetical protein [Nocardia sp. NPDC052566]|uniref:hypothetical protein n=1 Tax=Nocardia sp. NPDC052566 TaxID=3364330 RepID=UPI0037CC475E
MISGEDAAARPKYGPPFWRAATLAVPIAAAVSVLVFALFGSAITNSDDDADPAPLLLLGIAFLVLVAAAALLARKPIPWRRGAALGIATAAALLVYVWAVLG